MEPLSIQKWIQISFDHWKIVPKRKVDIKSKGKLSGHVKRNTLGASRQLMDYITVVLFVLCLMDYWLKPERPGPCSCETGFGQKETSCLRKVELFQRNEEMSYQEIGFSTETMRSIPGEESRARKSPCILYLQMVEVVVCSVYMRFYLLVTLRQDGILT